MNSSKFWRDFDRVIFIIGCAAIIAMMLVIAFNIIGRIFFKSPILGTLEIAGMTGTILIACAIGFTERDRRNVIVEIVANRLPPRVRAFTDAFTLLLSLIALAFLVWAMFNDSFYSASFNEKTLVLVAPVTPFKFIWSTGIFVLCLIVIRNIVISIRRGIKR